MTSGTPRVRWQAALTAVLLFIGLFVVGFSSRVGAQSAPRIGPAEGYWLLDGAGNLHGFGWAGDFDPVPGVGVALASAPEGGVWVLTSDGRVHARGGAPDLGDIIEQLAEGEHVSTIASVPDQVGYWVFTNLGRAVAFGSAQFHGDLWQLGLATQLGGDIVASTPTPTGGGYYMVGADGGVFAFGDAKFAGSIQEVVNNLVAPGFPASQWLAAPITALVPDPDGGGYWLIGADGGAFAFGAGFRGSVPAVLPAGSSLVSPVNGAISYGDGYLMVAGDGGVFNFSNRAFSGSLGGTTLTSAVVGISAIDVDGEVTETSLDLSMGAWEPDRVGACNPLNPNFSPAFLPTVETLTVGSRPVVEPGVVYDDEVFSVAIRVDQAGGTSPLRDLSFGREFVESGAIAADVTAYDDGTHGDTIANDGIYFAPCVEPNTSLLAGRPAAAAGPIAVVDSGHRGSVAVTDIARGVRSTPGGLFVQAGSHYTDRRFRIWELHLPETCLGCAVAWDVEGPVFDFFTITTREQLGGPGYARHSDPIRGTGFDDIEFCERRSHYCDVFGGRDHDELFGTVLSPTPPFPGLAHELGHGLVGMETRDFPGPGVQQWNSGDGAHPDADVTIDGALSGPFWDPARGWPFSIRVEISPGQLVEADIEGNPTDGFTIEPLDDPDQQWSDIFLYMMGVLSADQASDSYYKLVNPSITGCTSLETHLECPSFGMTVTAEQVIEFDVQDMVDRFGPWSSSVDFDPTRIQLGVVHMSDRPHTDAELVFLSNIYVELAQATDTNTSWSDDPPWAYTTKGRSTVELVEFG